MSNASDKPLEFQCPKCARRLKASPKAAGKRLKCPGCGQPVKVPGAAASATADDDWMNLDNLESVVARPSSGDAAPHRAATAQPGAATSPAASSSPSKDSPLAGKAPAPTPAGGEAGDAGQRPISTSIFDDDLPELADLEPPRPRSDLGGLYGLEGLEELVPPVVPPSPPVAAAGGKPAGGKADTSPSNATKSEASRRAELKERANQQYRVPCPACGTPQYVTVSQKGKTVKCPDCFLDFKIPPPPPGWKPSDKPATTTWSTDLVVQTKDEAERDASRARSRADEYLRTAEQELAEAEIDSLYQGDFDTQSFMRRTFGFCYDFAALAQVAAHSVVFAIGFAAVMWAANKIAEGDKGAALIAFLGVPLIFLLTAFPLFSAAMTLLESVANSEPKVREWPGFSFFEHFGELTLFAVALGVSASPGFLIGSMIGSSGGMSWMIIFGTLLTVFMLFPIIILSMLDNDSLFSFVSVDVLRSLSAGYESWAVYYFKTFIAFSIVFIAWAFLLGSRQPLLAGLAGLMLPWLLFFTSQQLGVLAGDISEHLSIVLEPGAKKEESEEE